MGCHAVLMSLVAFVDWIAPLKFQKTVVLLNPVVSALHKSLLLLTFAALAWNFWYQELAYAQDDVGKYLSVQFWFEGLDASVQAHELWDTMTGSGFCRSPELFDFWQSRWGWGYAAFQNYTCVPLCGSVQTEGDCMTIAETFVREGPDQFFLATSGQEFHESRRTPGVDPVERKRAFVNAFVGDTYVGFSYALHVPYRNWYEVIRDDLKKIAESEKADSNEKNTVTVILDKDREPTFILEGQDLKRLTLNQLLSMSGNPDGLFSHVPNIPMAVNQKSGSTFQEPPLGMISGFDLELKIQCYNYMKKDIGQKYQDKRYFCYVTVKDTQRWSDLRLLTIQESFVNSTIFQGVRIRIKGDGFFRRFDINSLLLNIAAFIVYLQVPGVLVLIFITTCLGDLSTIYYHELFDEFHLGERIANTTARLISHCKAFSMLEAEEVPGVPRERIQKQIEHMCEARMQYEASQNVEATSSAFRKRVGKLGILQEEDVDSYLTERESKLLSDFAIDVMQNRVKLRNRRQIRYTPPSGQDRFVGMANYLSACTMATDAVGFLSVIEMMSKDRKKGCLQRAFTPAYLKQYSRSWEEHETHKNLNEIPEPAEVVLKTSPNSGSALQHRGQVPPLELECGEAAQTQRTQDENEHHWPPEEEPERLPPVKSSEDCGENLPGKTTCRGGQSQENGEHLDTSPPNGLMVCL